MKCMFYGDECRGEVSFLRWLIFFFGYMAMCKGCREELTRVNKIIKDENE